MTDKLPDIVRELFAAINDRDAVALGRCLAEQAEYHFIVPLEPAVGRDDVVASFTEILAEPSRVQWDVLAFAQNGNHVFVERVDRFWFGEHEAFVECTGVIDLDDDGLITSVRDYVDLATWRERKAAALAKA
jgi:limonene-1,2-epoxide hydrolase